MTAKRPESEDPNAHETRRIAAVRPDSSSRVAAVDPGHPTVQIAKVIALDDVPVLMQARAIEGADSELRMIIAAIDGASSVAEIAEVAGVAAEQARAMIAELKSQGLVSLRSAIGIEHDPSQTPPAAEAKPPEYWLGGLKPRTSK